MNTDLRINKGATFEIEVDVANYVGPSYTALAYIKKSANDVTPYIECTITKVAENPGCIFRVELTAEQTKTFKTTGNSPMEPEPYVYDIIVMDPDNKVVRVLEGYALVYPGVTI